MYLWTALFSFWRETCLSSGRNFKLVVARPCVDRQIPLPFSDQPDVCIISLRYELQSRILLWQPIAFLYVNSISSPGTHPSPAQFSPPQGITSGDNLRGFLHHLVFYHRPHLPIHRCLGIHLCGWNLSSVQFTRSAATYYLNLGLIQCSFQPISTHLLSKHQINTWFGGKTFLLKLDLERGSSNPFAPQSLSACSVPSFIFLLSRRPKRQSVLLEEEKTLVIKS